MKFIANIFVIFLLVALSVGCQKYEVIEPDSDLQKLEVRSAEAGLDVYDGSNEDEDLIDTIDGITDDEDGDDEDDDQAQRQQ